jgi:hypothetical protein
MTTGLAYETYFRLTLAVHISPGRGLAPERPAVLHVVMFMAGSITANQASLSLAIRKSVLDRLPTGLMTIVRSLMRGYAKMSSNPECCTKYAGMPCHSLL